MSEYLSVRNWHKFQSGKDGKTRNCRSDWIKDYTDKDSDEDYEKLSLYQRALLDGIRRLRGRMGKNPPNDSAYIARALHCIATDRPRVRHGINTILEHGLLILTNQQHDFLEKRREEEKRGEMPNPAGLTPEEQKTTEEIDPLMISHRVVEELGLSLRAVGLVPAIAGAIEFCLKNEPGAGTKQLAMDFLIEEAQAHIKAGGSIDRFWFESQKWRKKRKIAEITSSGTIPSTDLVQQIRKRKAEVAAERARNKVQ